MISEKTIIPKNYLSLPLHVAEFKEVSFSSFAVIVKDLKPSALVTDTLPAKPLKQTFGCIGRDITVIIKTSLNLLSCLAQWAGIRGTALLVGSTPTLRHLLGMGSLKGPF